MTARRKQWLIDNQDHVRAYKKAWQSERMDQKRKYDRERYLRNREAIKKRSNANYHNRKQSNSRKCRTVVTDVFIPKQRRVTSTEEKINQQIRRRLSGRILRAVKKRYSAKATGTIQLLGCSIASFRIYIESKFEPGMTWENIHLDHIVPCALFDLTKPKHQKICFHFSNYQPLFAEENIKKGSRLFHGEGHLPL